MYLFVSVYSYITLFVEAYNSYVLLFHQFKCTIVINKTLMSLLLTGVYCF